MPSIYRRSLLRAGNGGLAIVIPKSWAKYYGLKPKDILRVKVNKNLTVYPEVESKVEGNKNVKNQYGN